MEFLLFMSTSKLEEIDCAIYWMIRKRKTNGGTHDSQVIQKIEKIADSIRNMLGDRLTGVKGIESREPERISDEEYSIIHD
ncbi:MAG: hypothetical protein OXE77_09995 [Flavobacteriaceae bacterium]|nr:hypothetical protein [Flavobacteriaceae bacterium]MCY4267251.1 hypothetical protein [Flavobacteriaceae bacterium]MCY4299520.1 hypothetical protein [Flavobacteriaceae bacterium]